MELEFLTLHGSKMSKYVPYVRTADGYIQRISHAIYNCADTSLHPYVHEESLVGWPESTVLGKGRRPQRWHSPSELLIYRLIPG